jgi:hypothetical protein
VVVGWGKKGQRRRENKIHWLLWKYDSAQARWIPSRPIVKMPLLDHFNLDASTLFSDFFLSQIFYLNSYIIFGSNEQSKPMVEMPPPIEKVPVMPVLGGYLFISNSQSEFEFLSSDMF